MRVLYQSNHYERIVFQGCSNTFQSTYHYEARILCKYCQYNHWPPPNRIYRKKVAPASAKKFYIACEFHPPIHHIRFEKKTREKRKGLVKYLIDAKKSETD